jgi:hypothetical protein
MIKNVSNVTPTWVMTLCCRGTVSIWCKSDPTWMNAQTTHGDAIDSSIEKISGRIPAYAIGIGIESSVTLIMFVSPCYMWHLAC